MQQITFIHLGSKGVVLSVIANLQNNNHSMGCNVSGVEMPIKKWVYIVLC